MHPDERKSEGEPRPDFTKTCVSVELPWPRNHQSDDVIERVRCAMMSAGLRALADAIERDDG